MDSFWFSEKLKHVSPNITFCSHFQCVQGPKPKIGDLKAADGCTTMPRRRHLTLPSCSSHYMQRTCACGACCLAAGAMLPSSYYARMRVFLPASGFGHSRQSMSGLDIRPLSCCHDAMPCCHRAMLQRCHGVAISRCPHVFSLHATHVHEFMLMLEWLRHRYVDPKTYEFSFVLE